MNGEELSKNDLFILMDSYKNNIQLNTTILEQLKQVLSLHTQLIDSQKELCKSFESLISQMKDNNFKMAESQRQIDSSINLSSANTAKIINEVYQKLNEGHSKLSLKMYVAYIGMTGIIISLIGLAISFADKFSSVVNALKLHIGGK